MLHHEALTPILFLASKSPESDLIYFGTKERQVRNLTLASEPAWIETTPLTIPALGGFAQLLLYASNSFPFRCFLCVITSFITRLTNRAGNR